MTLRFSSISTNISIPFSFLMCTWEVFRDSNQKNWSTRSRVADSEGPVDEGLSNYKMENLTEDLRGYSVLRVPQYTVMTFLRIRKRVDTLTIVAVTKDWIFRPYPTFNIFFTCSQKSLSIKELKTYYVNSVNIYLIELLYHLSFQSYLHTHSCPYRVMAVSGCGYSV